MTAPLVAASKANVVMITGQARALLDLCFRKLDGDIYQPIMVNMSLTRTVHQTGRGSPEASQPVTLNFSVPLISLVPINHIAVDKVNIEFDLEITSVAPTERSPLVAGVSPVVEDKAVLFGKISRTPNASGNDTRQPPSSHLKVNINAGPLPLPLGLLSIIELYSKSIQPAAPAPPAPPAPAKTTTQAKS